MIKNNVGTAKSEISERKYKILISGDNGVGKTAIVFQYCDQLFTTSNAGYGRRIFFGQGEDFVAYDQKKPGFKVKKIKLDNSQYTLLLTEQAKYERYEKIIGEAPYRGINGIFLVFDLSDRGTFVNIKQWMLEAERYSMSDCPMILLGNKFDLDESKQAGDEREILEFAEENNLIYVPVSAKYNIGIDQAFEAMAKLIDIRKDMGYRPTIKADRGLIELSKKELECKLPRNIFKKAMDKKDYWKAIDCYIEFKNELIKHEKEINFCIEEVLKNLPKEPHVYIQCLEKWQNTFGCSASGSKLWYELANAYYFYSKEVPGYLNKAITCLLKALDNYQNFFEAAIKEDPTFYEALLSFRDKLLIEYYTGESKVSPEKNQEKQIEFYLKLFQYENLSETNGEYRTAQLWLGEHYLAKITEFSEHEEQQSLRKSAIFHLTQALSHFKEADKDYIERLLKQLFTSYYEKSSGLIASGSVTNDKLAEYLKRFQEELIDDEQKIVQEKLKIQEAALEKWQATISAACDGIPRPEDFVIALYDYMQFVQENFLCLHQQAEHRAYQALLREKKFWPKEINPDFVHAFLNIIGLAKRLSRGNDAVFNFASLLYSTFCDDFLCLNKNILPEQNINNVQNYEPALFISLFRIDNVQKQQATQLEIALGKQEEENNGKDIELEELSSKQRSRIDKVFALRFQLTKMDRQAGGYKLQILNLNSAVKSQKIC